MKNRMFHSETNRAESYRAGRLLFCLLTGLLLLESGCGHGSSSPGSQQTITVSVSPPAVTMDSGQSQVFNATVANDTTGAGVAWSVSGGGSLSGSTTTATTFTATSATVATLTATSKASAAASASASITVNPALTMHGPVSASATVGTPYSDTSASASGGSGTKTFTVASGALPGGLNLNSSTGAISGTPNTAGTFTFTVAVTDAATVPVTVAASPATITVAAAAAISVSLNSATPSLESGQSMTLVATVANDPANKGVTWTVSGGGTISGSTTTSTTFKASSTTAGATATVTATSVSDSTKTAVANITITAGPQITTQGAIPNGTVGVAYSKTLAETGGTAPFTYALISGSLPAGLALASATGMISGTPTTAVASLGFTITVTDSAAVPQTYSSPMTITINPAGTLSITTSSLPNGIPNSAYTATLAASGGVAPYTWAVTSGALPSGVTLNGSTGVISGTPTATTDSTVTVQATDSQPTPATATHIFSLVVQPALPAGVNDILLNGTYAFQIAGISNGGSSGVDYGAAAIGSLTFDGASNITSGVEDLNNINGLTTNNPVTGTYTVGSDYRGTILLDNGSSVATFAIAVGNVANSVAKTIRIIRFDDNGLNGSGIVATGVAKLQTSSAFSPLNATWVFGLQGHSPCVGCAAVPVTPFGPVSLVGTFTASAGTIISGQEDGAAINNSYNNVTLSGSSNTPSATTGRGTLTLLPTGILFPAAPTHFVYYVVNSSKIFLMSIDPHGGGSSGLYSLLSGDADAQQVTTYNSTTLSGSSIGYGNIGGGDGISTNPTGTGAGIYRYTFNQGANTTTVTVDSNSSGTLSSQSYPTTSYVLSAAGRLSVPSVNTAPIIYFYADGAGYGTQQPNSVQTGNPGLITFEAQMAGPFSLNSFDSSYIFASLPPHAYDQGTTVGVINVSPSGAITGTLNQSQNNGTLVNGQAISGTYALDPGTGATTGRGTIPGSLILYIIQPGRLVSIDSTATSAPNTTVFDSQTSSASPNVPFLE